MRDPRPELDLTSWQAVRTQAFWLTALTSASWSGVVSSITVHLANFLVEDLKAEYVAAVGVLSFFAAVSLIGRAGFGFLADYVNVRLLLAVLFVAQGIGLFLFSRVQTLAEAPFYVILFAIPYGGTLPLNTVIRGYFFGRRRFGTIGGLLQMVNLPFSVAAPVWVGFLADTVPGGYRWAFRAIAMMLMVGAVAMVVARRPRHPLPSDQPPRLLQLFLRRQGVASGDVLTKSGGRTS